MSSARLNRVLVTGVGGITPLGNSIPKTWFKMKTTRESGIKPIRSLPDYETQYKPHIPKHFPDTLHVGSVDYNQVVSDMVSNGVVSSPTDLKNMNKSTGLLLSSVDECLHDADILTVDGGIQTDFFTRFGTAIGTGIASIQDTYDSILQFHGTGGNTALEEGQTVQKKSKKLSPYVIPKILSNIPSSYIHIKYGLQGPMMSFSSACATGTQSIGEAYLKMLHGHGHMGERDSATPQAMICGASESSVHPMSLAGFHRAKSLSSMGESKPFDSSRNGFVLGEGCGVLLLEELNHWKARKKEGKEGKEVYAEICGYGNTTDGYHITSPHPEGDGAYRCMKQCLPAELLLPECPRKVIYINCHATSTKLGDISEIKAIVKLFKGTNHKVFIIGSKGHLGHLLGAAGSVESILSVLSLKEGTIPGVLNLKEIDSEIQELMLSSSSSYDNQFQIVTDTIEHQDIDYCIKNSFGFGGINTSICFRKFIE